MANCQEIQEGEAVKLILKSGSQFIKRVGYKVGHVMVLEDLEHLKFKATNGAILSNAAAMKGMEEKFIGSRIEPV